MKKLSISALALVPLALFAQETGRVISSTPVVQQVAVQRQACTAQAVPVERQTSGLGGLMGAIAGAALGSQVGSGNGRIAATVIGTAGGAILGNQIEGGGTGHVQQVQNCTPQTSYENRTVGYNVTYEYAGRQYTTQLPYDPGATIQLQVTPMGAGRPPAGGQPLVTAPPVSQAEPVTPTVTHTIIQPAPLHTVVYPSYAYPYSAYPSYGYGPAISLSLGYVGHRHYRHHHGHTVRVPRHTFNQ
jgi:uncharacterized protein YcfJ